MLSPDFEDRWNEHQKMMRSARRGALVLFLFNLTIGLGVLGWVVVKVMQHFDIIP